MKLLNDTQEYACGRHHHQPIKTSNVFNFCLGIAPIGITTKNKGSKNWGQPKLPLRRAQGQYYTVKEKQGSRKTAQPRKA